MHVNTQPGLPERIFLTKQHRFRAILHDFVSENFIPVNRTEISHANREQLIRSDYRANPVIELT